MQRLIVRRTDRWIELKKCLISPKVLINKYLTRIHNCLDREIHPSARYKKMSTIVILIANIYEYRLI